MTIDEAITILINHNPVGHNEPGADKHRAINLGIEALKAIKLLGTQYPAVLGQPLPGETEED